MQFLGAASKVEYTYNIFQHHHNPSSEEKNINEDSFEMPLQLTNLSLRNLTDFIGEGNSSSATDSFFRSSQITTEEQMYTVTMYMYISMNH